MSAQAAEQIDYEQLASHIVRSALERGASDAECTVAEGSEFSVNVRMAEVERLTEAGSRGAGVRVLMGKQTGSAYTSDLSRQGLDAMVESALDLARVTTEDPSAGLPAEAEMGAIDTDLQLYWRNVVDLPTAEKISRATRAEAASLAVDPRIFNSEGGSFSTHAGQRIFANSRGFLGSYRTTRCSSSAVPVAREGASMERDYWSSSARNVENLEEPEAIGRQAAERAIRRLGARKVSTQRVPIVFEPRTARSLLDHLFDAVNGDSIYRHESFLADRLGQQVASPQFTLVDDATLPGLFGSAPFDDEGVPSRRTVVIEQGILRSYLLNTYTARKLGMRSTGSGSRGLTGNAGVGHGNFYLEQGGQSQADIVKSVPTGFLVTELMGFGVNVVTGDYSRGAAGMWIENGEIAYPVSEVTIASTLQEMLMGIEVIGSDLEFRGSIASPTIVIREMTVSGQ